MALFARFRRWKDRTLARLTRFLRLLAELCLLLALTLLSGLVFPVMGIVVALGVYALMRLWRGAGILASLSAAALALGAAVFVTILGLHFSGH